MRAPRVIQLRPRDRVADFAHVVMEAIVDTFGLIEPGSAKVVSTTAPDWVVELQLQDLRDSRYEPGEVQGKKVRVRIETSVQIRFGGRGRTR
jgi:hypothetical protein